MQAEPKYVAVANREVAPLQSVQMLFCKSDQCWDSAPNPVETDRICKILLHPRCFSRISTRSAMFSRATNLFYD